ncbi:MAG TPA: GNAT family N-acetyltransferase [Rhodoglobus sp.]|nr:GNAT family N-acetyltransferase [Rhodoglobus sp.]
MASEVIQDVSMNRFELLVDGEQVGLSDYRIRDDSIVILHTEIDPSRRGEGLGDLLARGMLNLIRADTDHRVVPLCPFTKKWIDEHEDYQDLLTR